MEDHMIVIIQKDTQEPALRQLAGENGDLAGVLYLGSVPERTTDVHAVLDSLPEQPWQFVADIPADRWVTAPGGGRELYCIFAVRREDTLFVYEKQDPAYPAQLGKELYGRQGGQPILLLCNGSREDTDTMVTVYCSTGRPLDWNPQLSAETGRPVPVEGGLRRLDTASIYYLESEGHRVHFYTDEGDFSAPGALKAFEEKLADCPFARCNSGYLVNLAQVRELRQSTVQVGPCELQVSRPKRKAFLAALTDYIGGEGS